MIYDAKRALGTAIVVVATLYLDGKLSGDSDHEWFGWVLALLVAAFLVVYFCCWYKDRKKAKAKELEELRHSVLIALDNARYAGSGHYLYDDVLHYYNLLLNKLPAEVRQQAPVMVGSGDWKEREAVREFLTVGLRDVAD